MTTRRQLEVLRFLIDFERSHGYAPTQKQIADALHTSKGSINFMLGRLVEAGYLRRGRKYSTGNLDVVEPKLAELDNRERIARCARFTRALVFTFEQIDKYREATCGNSS